MPVRAAITSGTVADCTLTCRVMDGFDADYVLADKGHDSDSLIEHMKEHGMKPVIPPRKNRKNQREYAHYLYHCSHLVENAIVELRKRRGIAMIYMKNTASFLAAVHIRCIGFWAKAY